MTFWPRGDPAGSGLSFSAAPEPPAFRTEACTAGGRVLTPPPGPLGGPAALQAPG